MEPRRSARNKNKKQKTEESANKENADVICKTKAAKPATKKRLTGRLAGFVNMPLDILFEIFGYLHPADLLRLARLTKALRRVLMHRSSLTVWTAAREQLPEFPEPFSGMSEPAWANLVFDAHCHFCLKNGIRNIEWGWKVRICTKCSKQHARVFEHGQLSEVEIMTNTNARNLVVTRITTPKYDTECLVSDYNEIIDTLATMKDDGAQKIEEFVEQRKEEITAFKELALKCAGWSMWQSMLRSDELRVLKAKRHNAIVDKLEELGFDELDEMTDDEWESFRDHKLVNQPHLLTERIWNNIEAPMVAFMTVIRAQVAVRRRVELINNRKLSAATVLQVVKKVLLPRKKLQPELADWCEFPAVKRIIEQPSDVEVGTGSFAPILTDRLLGEVRDWRIGCEAQLYKMVTDAEEEGQKLYGTPPPPAGQPDLRRIAKKLTLASTAFGCRNCGTCKGDDCKSDDSYDDFDFSDKTPFISMPLFFPEVLYHRCLTRTRHKDLLNQEDYSTLLDYDYGDRCRWNTKYICLDEELCAYAARVVTSAGLDPETTTVDDMDDLGGFFACMFCAKECGVDDYTTMNVYGWRHAVEHNELHHPGDVVSWGLISNTLVEECREGPAETYHSNNYHCYHCLDSIFERPAMDIDDVKDHLQTEHAIAQPEIKVDYLKRLGLPPLASISKTKIRVKGDTEIHYYESDTDSEFSPEEAEDM